MAGCSNKNLNRARKEKNDSFFTLYNDIEMECNQYKEHFKDKIVYCNCDNPEWSNFYKYFELNFIELGLKKLITTHYEVDKPTYKLEVSNNNGELVKIKTDLKQNGDFRSPECIEILKESDIVVTNPPFSLVRDFITLLFEHNKKFLFIGTIGMFGYSAIWKCVQERKLWHGYRRSMGMWFRMPDSYETTPNVKIVNGERCIHLGNIAWLTNMEHDNMDLKVELTESYEPDKYPKYDNYDAINVNKTKDIPKDYYEPMGVPLSFLRNYSPEQFELIGLNGFNNKERYGLGRFYLNDKEVFRRIVIKRKKSEEMQ